MAQGGQAAPLVHAGQGGGWKAARLEVVAAKKAAPKAEAPNEAEAPEAEAPATASGGKVWFSLMGPDELRPELEDKAMLLDIVSFLFFPIGAGIWAPMLLVGASFDMEWALPVIVYTAASVVCFWVLGWWTGITFLLGFAVDWIGTEVMMENLNRPEIKLSK